MSGPAPGGPAVPGSGWPEDPAAPDTPVAHDPAEVRALAAGAGTLAELAARQSVCRACPRLVEWREQVARVKRRAHLGEPYWGRPIAGWGDDRPSILIVGLAPRRTAGTGPGASSPGTAVATCSSPRCTGAGWPPGRTASGRRRPAAAAHPGGRRGPLRPPVNKPTVTERDTCAPWLTAELGYLAGDLRVIVCLGAFAWQALWPVLGALGLPGAPAPAALRARGGGRPGAGRPGRARARPRRGRPARPYPATGWS